MMGYLLAENLPTRKKKREKKNRESWLAVAAVVGSD